MCIHHELQVHYHMFELFTLAGSKCGMGLDGYGGCSSPTSTTCTCLMSETYTTPLTPRFVWSLESQLTEYFFILGTTYPFRNSQIIDPRGLLWSRIRHRCEVGLDMDTKPPEIVKAKSMPWEYSLNRSHRRSNALFQNAFHSTPRCHGSIPRSSDMSSRLDKLSRTHMHSLSPWQFLAV